jgi:predicted acylesterase/phospholipase RssA
MATRVPTDVEQAQSVISSRAGKPLELHALAMRLLDRNKITYACQVLSVAEELHRTHDELWFKIQRRLALCTYKDPDQPLSDRLNAAEARLKTLLTYADLPRKDRQDSLGILGGINKQRWRAFGSRLHLENSIAFYKKAVEDYGGPESDGGYTAINAAFVLDALADLDRDGASRLTESGRARRAEARDLREKILRVVPAEPPADFTPPYVFWHHCTRGEALLGLHRYDDARDALRQAAKLSMDNWQREAAARQLADLARLHRNLDDAAVDEKVAWNVVATLLEADPTRPDAAERAEEAARLLVGGKVGLALSGGGFRASLFHIGVLAKLAELDVLRHVEAISCVSGGSIVGAYYYLKLQRLLEERDDALERDDYIRLVREMEQEFVGGIQRNIRNLMLFGFKSNWTVLTSRQSSMTHRLGDLYERELYSRIADGRQQRPRLLTDLMVKPGGNASFAPKSENWKRRAKVPILVLNATTLNTCHSWQFTATFMGEPPTRSINTDINSNDRLRRMYHEEAPAAYQGTMRLGHSVAASACVPGLFDPLILENLYEGGYITRLVDGGVYDNQGIASLLEQDCTVLLISDASGQTGKEIEPADSRLGVMTRTQNVLMARVREAQYELLTTLSSSSLLRGVMYLHLKRDLEPQQVDWYRCPNPTPKRTAGPLTTYGIRRDVQEKLAALRTDLDAFSDVEADALMLSGYLMAEKQFKDCIKTIPISEDETPIRWRFQAIEKLACAPKDDPRLSSLLRALDVGAELALKPFFMSTGLRWSSAAVVLATVAAVLYRTWTSWTAPVMFSIDRRTLITVVITIPILLVAGAIGRWIARRSGYHNKPQRMVFSLVMCLGGFAIVRVFSWLTDPFFLRGGPKYERVPYSAGELGGSAGKAAIAREDDRLRT